MVKLFISLVIAILLLIFATQNMHPVWVIFVAGPAVQMPVIVLITGAIVAGYALATFNYLMRSAKKRGESDGKEN